MDSVYLWVNIGQAALLLIMGYIYKFYPPKKPNYIYGYRTRRTMSNQNIWDYANKIGARMIILAGWLVMVIGVLSTYLFPDESILITAAAMVITLLAGYYFCELDLNRHFDREGNTKAKP